jgi:hypothetical protein
LRYDLRALGVSAISHHLAKACQVAQRGVEATAGKLGACGVDRDVGIVLGAQPGPNALRQVIGQRLASDTAVDPAQGVGIDGFV